MRVGSTLPFKQLLLPFEKASTHCREMAFLWLTMRLVNVHRSLFIVLLESFAFVRALWYSKC